MEHTSLSNVVLTNVRLAEREVEEVRGCQGRSLPDELNKCFMNFKQLAVCPPAVLKDQRFPKKKKKKAEYRLIEGICIYLHSFCNTLICLLLLEVYLQRPSLLCFFLHGASVLEQNSFSLPFFSFNLRSFSMFRKRNVSALSFIQLFFLKVQGFFLLFSSFLFN